VNGAGVNGAGVKGADVNGDAVNGAGVEESVNGAGVNSCVHSGSRGLGGGKRDHSPLPRISQSLQIPAQCQYRRRDPGIESGFAAHPAGSFLYYPVAKG